MSRPAHLLVVTPIFARAEYRRAVVGRELVRHGPCVLAIAAAHFGGGFCHFAGGHSQKSLSCVFCWGLPRIKSQMKFRA